MSESICPWPKEQVTLNQNHFNCQGGSAGQRRIVVNYNIPFSSLEQLVSAYPELLDWPNTLAILVNFILVGEHFRVITDTQAFKREYLMLYTEEEKRGELNTATHHPYGRFDVSNLHPPILKVNLLIFFALSEINDLPYRVSCPYPFQDKQLNAKYELLPL